MPVYDNGSAINFANVTHAWVTDGEIMFYFIGGSAAGYLSPMAEKMWKDYNQWLEDEQK